MTNLPKTSKPSRPWGALTELGALKGQFCILGFGNRLWSDDGAGSHLAEALQDCPGVDAIDGGFVPENHLEVVVRTKPDTILLVDAADFGGQPGELRVLKPDDVALSGVSTHAGSPQMLAKYLEARSGAKVFLLAIQPGDTSAGEGMSPQVAATVSKLARFLSS